MSINPKIIRSINELEKTNQAVKSFLLELLTYEIGNSGWYKDYYKKSIEKFYSKDGEDDEN